MSNKKIMPIKQDKFKARTVLYISSWYPNRHSSLNGIFFEKDARILNVYCNLIVLYVGFSPLNKKKFETEISESDNLKAYKVYIKGAETPHIRNIFDAINYFRAAFIGIRKARKQFGKPDLIHANVIEPAGIFSFFISMIFRIPYFIYEHSSVFSPYDNRYRNYPKAIKFLVRLAVKNAATNFTTSSFLAAAMKEHKLYGNFKVVNPAIDREVFSPASSKSRSEVIKMIHISALDPLSKNPAGIIQAVVEVLKCRKNIRLDIIGGSSLVRKPLEEMSQKAGIKDKYVFFHGEMPGEKHAEMLRNADFFVLNSNYETFGIVLAEAMMSGIPVLSTRCGGPEDFVTEKTGMLVENGRLAEGIFFMLDHYRDYSSYFIRKYALEKFGTERFADDIISSYDQIL